MCIVMSDIAVNMNYFVYVYHCFVEQCIVFPQGTMYFHYFVIHRGQV